MADHEPADRNAEASEDADADPTDGRDESLDERMDRNWNEMLQELRVTQTGTQILTGFLLAIAFQNRFEDLTTFQHRVYLILVLAAVTTTALGLKGSTAIATSKDFPGAIPDHLVFAADFVKEHKTEVQALVQTWFDTLAWIKSNPDKAVGIMAKRGGVTAADYQTYDAGTTIFTKQQNLDAFAAGSTPANLDYQAQQIGDFLVSTGLAEAKPSLTEQTWFWVAVGAAVAVVGTTVILLASRGETFPEPTFGTARGN